MGGARRVPDEVPPEAVRIASEPTALDLDEDPTTAEARTLLAEHVPLALLADLATPQGPPSQDIVAAEGLPEEPWWSAGSDGAAPDGAPSASGSVDPTGEETAPTDG